MRRLVCVVLLLAACGGARPASPPVDPCGDRAVGRIAKALRVGPEALSEISCVAVADQFLHRYWFDGRGADDGEDLSWRAVVTGAEVGWVERLDVEQEGLLTIRERSAVDLDADQTDEVLLVEDAGDPGCGASDLIVVGIAGTPPAQARVFLSSWCTDQVACTGRWRRVAGGVEVTREGDCGIHPAREVLRWTGAALEPAP
jgi:hypothetical protein